MEAESSETLNLGKGDEANVLVGRLAESFIFLRCHFLILPFHQYQHLPPPPPPSPPALPPQWVLVKDENDEVVMEQDEGTVSTQEGEVEHAQHGTGLGMRAKVGRF